MHREKIVRKVGTIEGFEEQPLSTCILSLSALSRRNGGTRKRVGVFEVMFTICVV